MKIDDNISPGGKGEDANVVPGDEVGSAADGDTTGGEPEGGDETLDEVIEELAEELAEGDDDAEGDDGDEA